MWCTMIGADLLERFRRAGLEAAGQRRNVTILFVDISGYTRSRARSRLKSCTSSSAQFTERLLARRVQV